MSKLNIDQRLKFFGGHLGGLIPFIVLLSGIAYLAMHNQAGTKPFWACGFMAITVGLFLCKNKKEYCAAIMRGIGDKNGIVIIIAWVFASVLGKLMVGAGMVKGILWLGMSTGLEGAMFTLVVFVSAALFSVGTGTANGTAIALSPVFFPAGVFLGADPTFLALAILSGGAFGDNLAPISDTTIVSAYTQGARMNDVVRSRFPLAITAAGIAMIILFMFGGGGTVQSLPELTAQMDPKSSLLLIALVVVIASALTGRHIIESLTYGIVAACCIGVAIGNITFYDIFHLPAKRGMTTGLIQDGINGVVGAVIFVIFIMAVARIFIESGLMKDLMSFFERTLATTVRKAEFVMFGVSALTSALVTANGPALLLVGPTVVKPLGEKFKLARARCANLMDCAVCSFFYMLPWSLAVLVWYNSINNAAEAFSLTPPPIFCSFMAPYPWALFVVVLISIATGWNRRFVKDEPAEGANTEEAVA